MSKAKALSTFGTKPTFSSADLKNAGHLGRERRRVELQCGDFAVAARRDADRPPPRVGPLGFIGASSGDGLGGFAHCRHLRFAIGTNYSASACHRSGRGGRIGPSTRRRGWETLAIIGIGMILRPLRSAAW